MTPEAATFLSGEVERAAAGHEELPLRTLPQGLSGIKQSSFGNTLTPPFHPRQLWLKLRRHVPRILSTQVHPRENCVHNVGEHPWVSWKQAHAST